jgi:hypothetical protein
VNEELDTTQNHGRCSSSPWSPTENHSYTPGSLEHNTIRKLWTKEPGNYPGESCMECGKQRSRRPTALAGSRVLPERGPETQACSTVSPHTKADVDD